MLEPIFFKKKKNLRQVLKTQAAPKASVKSPFKTRPKSAAAAGTDLVGRGGGGGGEAHTENKKLSAVGEKPNP